MTSARFAHHMALIDAWKEAARINIKQPGIGIQLVLILDAFLREMRGEPQMVRWTRAEGRN